MPGQKRTGWQLATVNQLALCCPQATTAAQPCFHRFDHSVLHVSILIGSMSWSIKHISRHSYTTLNPAVSSPSDLQKESIALATSDPAKPQRGKKKKKKTQPTHILQGLRHFNQGGSKLSWVYLASLQFLWLRPSPPPSPSQAPPYPLGLLAAPKAPNPLVSAPERCLPFLNQISYSPMLCPSSDHLYKRFSH